MLFSIPEENLHNAIKNTKRQQCITPLLVPKAALRFNNITTKGQYYLTPILTTYLCGTFNATPLNYSYDDYFTNIQIIYFAKEVTF